MEIYRIRVDESAFQGCAMDVIGSLERERQTGFSSS